MHVRLTHGLERVLAAVAISSPLEELERLPEAAPDGHLEELLLRPEQAEEVGLGDAGPPGDVLGRRPLVAGLGELDERRLEDGVLALGGGETESDRVHGGEG